MDIEHLLENLVKEFNLDAVPQKNKDGIYELFLPPEFRLGLSSQETGVFFSSLLCPIPKEGREALFIFLMKANLIGQGTGGGVIGVDSTEKHFTFSLYQPKSLTYKDFKESLEDFLNYLEYWQREIPLYGTKLI